MRKCEVLSITTAPVLAARGVYSAEILAPGEESTMSVPRKSKSARLRTSSSSSSPKDTLRPTERSEASATTSSAGKARSAIVLRISRPTAPVAPTTANLYPISKVHQSLKSEQTEREEIRRAAGFGKRRIA